MIRTCFWVSAIALITQFADAATFVVENFDDSGPGSLRQAILDSNDSPAVTNNLITFNIPNAGPHYIYLNTALPVITQSVTIDGYTQPDAIPNTISTSNDAVIQIRIDGSTMPESGFRLHGGPSIIRGLAIVQFGLEGVELAGSGGHVVEGNFIGLDPDGVSVAPNGNAGVKIDNSTGNRIGGTSPASRNIIAGNTTVEILLSGNGASNNVVQGNLIGVDRAGAFDLGFNTGIHLSNCRSNLIGGSTTGARNVIPAENNYGILVSGTSFNNKVQGNFIGTDVTGNDGPALGNGEGIFIDTSGSSGNIIGGTNTGEGNLIAFNLGRGIHVSAGTNFAMRGNAIFDNAELGIDLDTTPGVTANDSGDTDAGANQLQNFPVLTSAQITTSNVTIQGTLRSVANTTYAIDFFSNLRRDSSGHGEGQHYLGSTNVVTDSGGNAPINLALNTTTAGRYITATATDSSGNSSEFSSALLAISAYPTVTFTVINTNDTGAGSLRQAILNANNVTGLTNVTITFNIPGSGPHVISPSTVLPTIERSMLIDGYTQPGSSANTASNGFNAVLKIHLDGVDFLEFDGLQLTGDLSTIRGLAFTRFASGLLLSGFDHRVEGCVGGLTESGIIRSNGIAVRVFDGSGHVIGGFTPAARNVFSGNTSDGVRLHNSVLNSVVQGNLIGTDFTGEIAVPNEGRGIYVEGAAKNLIGGSVAGARNIISGNKFQGIGLYGSENRVEGNYIGLNAAGTAAVPNGFEGIEVSSVGLNIIGGATSASRNVISGNSGTGISVQFFGTSSNRITGNFIGTDASGMNPVPNAYAGISVFGDNNSIGGSTEEGNRIAYNLGAGVLLSAETNNAVRRNEIFSNGGFEIAFNVHLVVPNDIGDEDDGPNHLQNFPVLTSAAIHPATTRIQGTLNSLPNSVYALDFFSSAYVDPSGFGEGHKYLGSTNVTTDGSGNVTFDVTFSVTTSGRQITSTATDAYGNTSQFSQALSATSTISPRTFTVVNTNDSGAGSLRQAILDSALFPASANHTIAFSIPGTDLFTISPLNPLPASVEPLTFDGFTQPGAIPATSTDEDNAVRKIRLSGRSVGTSAGGFAFTTSGNILRGLEITQFDGDGVEITTSGNAVEGCYIFSNALNGIIIGNTTANTIGGSTPAKRNVISGNSSHGIEVLDSASNVIQGNFIGANLQAGIEIAGSGSISNLVQANHIGATPLRSNLGNADGGVRITDNASGNVIGEPRGSTESSLMNLIAYNQQDGIYATSGSNNTFRANRIFENGHLGIDLDPNAVNLNDNADTDVGANFKQNFPIVTNAMLTASNLMIQGTLNSRPSTSYQIDFFRNVLCDQTLHGEGEYFIGTAFITTDLSGNAVFNLSVPGNNGFGSFVTCTATDPAGNTSEFSPCTHMDSDVPPETFTVTTTADSGTGSLREAIILANQRAANAAHSINFAIPGAGIHLIQLLTPLPAITMSVNINGSTQSGSVSNSPAIKITGNSLADTIAALRIESDNTTIQNIQLCGFRQNAVRMENAANTVIDKCVFGGLTDDELIGGDCIVAIGSCDLSQIDNCFFFNVGGHCVSAPANTSIRVENNACDQVQGKLVNRTGSGGPATPTILTARCLGTGDEFEIEVQCNGSPNAPVKVELQKAANDFPVKMLPAKTTSLFLNGSGSSLVVSQLPRTLGTVGVSATVTQGNTNTSSSSSIRAWDYCESTFGDFLSTAANTPQGGQAADPISTFSGELYDSLPPDLSLGGPMPLRFQRFYGSRLVSDAKISSKLGENWLHNFDMILSNKVSTVEVVLFPGVFLVFTNQTGAYNLLNRPDRQFQLRATNADFVVHDPARSRLFTFSNGGRLVKIEDRRGNAHTLSYVGANLSSVTDGLGRTLSFQYDAGGVFLTNVTDGARSVGFTQGTNLLLTSRTPLAFTTTYSYAVSNAFYPVDLPLPSFLEKATRPETNAPLFQYWNAAGGVSSQLQGSGAWSLSYFGDVTRVRDPFGFNVLQTHNSNGWMTAWTDEAGKTIGLHYDSSGRRTHVTNRLGKVVALAYDNNDRVIAITNELGRVTTLAYTNLSVNGFTITRLQQVNYPDGTTEQFSYDSAGNTTAYIDPAGQTTRFSYNFRGQLLASTNATGGVISYTYNSDGTLASHHNPETGFTLFGYDQFKRMTNVTHPDNAVRHWVYDADGRMTSLTDERTNTTQFKYDRNGRLTQAIDPNGKTNLFFYDTTDRFSHSTDRVGNASSQGYDARNLLAVVTDKNGHSTRFNYDRRQRLSSVVLNHSDFRGGFAYDEEARAIAYTNANLEITRFTRDATGRVVGQTNALGHVISVARDPLGRITNKVDELGRSFSYAYDQRGLLTNASHPGLGSAAYQRNALGLPVLITDLNGRQWNLSYSPVGRLQSIGDPLSRSNSFVYDNRGRLQQTAFADGTGVTNTYDSANNLTRRRYSDGTDLQFAYDRLNRVTNANGMIFTYDAEGRLLSEQSAGITMSAAYDAGGRLTNLTYNGLFSVKYQYNSRNEVTFVEDTLTGTQLTFVHDAASRLRFIHRPNNIKTTHTYDATGRLTRVQDGDFNTNIIDVTYTLDAAGQVTAADFHAPLDPVNHASTNAHYFNYDNAHQINNAGYVYDGRGRLRNTPDQSYTFDGGSRLTQINSTTLGYDALNQIVTRSDSGVTTRFVHSRALRGSPIIAERNEITSQFLRYYVWAPNGTLLYMIDASNGNAVRFYHFDRVGTTLALTDESGAVTDAYAWTPYGELLARTGTNPQPFTYIGRFGVRYEPTGNVFHMRARYYDPLSARFLSRDPVWPTLRNPQNLDPYLYASTQPLRYIDPAGTQDIDVLLERNQLSDNAEVTTVTPGRNSKGVAKTSFAVKFAEEIDRDTVDDRFGAYLATDDELTDSVIFPQRDPSKASSLIWDNAAFDVSWNNDDTEVTFTFQEEPQLPTDRDSDRTPDYLVRFGTGDQLHDRFTRDEKQYLKLSDNPYQKGVSGENFERDYRFTHEDADAVPSPISILNSLNSAPKPESILDDVDDFRLIN